ncbi:MAG: hypothetical protein OFPI_27290 [Osedax symbiont Rs2]|nr:MAG: hypothetical protein OFPI_27290 [Osedax symbiont Rs2]
MSNNECHISLTISIEKLFLNRYTTKINNYLDTIEYNVPFHCEMQFL